MRRDQLEHAIRTACQINGMPEVIVVGSNPRHLPGKEQNFVAALVRGFAVAATEIAH